MSVHHLISFHSDSSLITSMANPKLQLFQSLRQFFDLIGFHTSQLQTSVFNWRNVSMLVMCLLYSISSAAYLIFEADNVVDYGFSFYTFITHLINAICIPTVIIKMTNIFALMDEYAAFIETS